MIDVHAHFLPGIDDGAKNAEESIAMMEDSFRQGVRVLFATPHCILHRQEDAERFLRRRQRAFEEIAEKARDCRVPKIYLGAEVLLDNDINRYADAEKLCYENTNIMLLEFPTEKMDLRWSEWIYNLNRKGIKVLVAHIDRYREWEKMMREFKGLDVEYQVNASKFAEFGAGKTLRELMKYSHDYVVGSDMHNMKRRACNMEAAYKKAAKKYGANADMFFGNNAKKILQTD